MWDKIEVAATPIPVSTRGGGRSTEQSKAARAIVANMLQNIEAVPYDAGMLVVEYKNGLPALFLGPRDAATQQPESGGILIISTKGYKVPPPTVCDLESIALYSDDAGPLLWTVEDAATGKLKTIASDDIDAAEEGGYVPKLRKDGTQSRKASDAVRIASTFRNACGSSDFALTASAPTGIPFVIRPNEVERTKMRKAHQKRDRLKSQAEMLGLDYPVWRDYTPARRAEVLAAHNAAAKA